MDKNADVDEFYKVAAVAGDPAVVAALNSIPNVTDVKPFMTEAAGLAYYFNYKNYISHDNPSLGTYKQQVVLVYSRADDPVVLHTEGYTLSGIQSGEGNKNRLDKMDFPTFLYTLSKDYADYNNKFNVNCVAVEYRYHGFSLPEGNTDKFTYLNAKEHSADLHAIVTDLKKYLFKPRRCRLDCSVAADPSQSPRDCHHGRGNHRGKACYPWAIRWRPPAGCCQ